VNFIANILAAIGAGAATTGTQGCYWFFMDEAKMPKCLIEK
jgi:cyclic lactone autoinducer peptide